MKKIVIPMLAICAMLTSCVENNMLDVTVVGKAKKNFADEIMMMPSDGYCKAVTGSGDTVEVVVDESIYLDSVMPYKAKMRKPTETRFGFIEAENQK